MKDDKCLKFSEFFMYMYKDFFRFSNLYLFQSTLFEKTKPTVHLEKITQNKSIFGGERNGKSDDGNDTKEHG